MPRTDPVEPNIPEVSPVQPNRTTWQRFFDRIVGNEQHREHDPSSQIPSGSVPPRPDLSPNVAASTEDCYVKNVVLTLNGMANYCLFNIFIELS